jgi:RNA recognition motif-containing protein
MKENRNLQEFFNEKLRELGVCSTSEESHPVLEARINWPFAFLDFSTAELATQCQSFNNVYCQGSKLEIQRPKSWMGGILFLGNLTTQMTEDRLREFLLSTMKYTGLLQSCSSSGSRKSFGKSPIEKVQLHDRYAFITFSSARDAAQALHLDRVPFLGTELRIRRKAGWNQEEESVENWRDVLSRHIASLPLFDCDVSNDKQSLVVVSNLPSSNTYSDQVLVDFLGSAMQQVGINFYRGSPVVHFELSRKYKAIGGFLKLRSAQEATLALRLNGIPFQGHVLQINRPAKWKGPSEQIWEWKDVLADFFPSATTEPPGEIASSPAQTMKKSDMMRSRESALQQQKEFVKLERQKGAEERIQEELAQVRQQLECKCTELRESQNELQRTKTKLGETQQREIEASNRDGILEKKLEEREEKYQKMADRMADAMGELLAHQGTLRAMQKEIESEREMREQAEGTIKKLQDDLEAAVKENRRRMSTNQKTAFLQVDDFYK